MNDEPKAAIVDLSEVTDDLSGPHVVKIVRPCNAKSPSFEIYTEDGGLILAFPFGSEVGDVLKGLVGEEGTTYHNGFQLADGRLSFDGTPMEGLAW